jgi:hypothetical protein
MTHVEHAIREVIGRYPAVEPVLRRVAVRLAKTGALTGRMKLDARMSDEALAGLGRLVAGAALQTTPAGDSYLRFDRMGIAPDDGPLWIAAICAALDMPADDAAARRTSDAQAAATIHDRCRLAYPDLAPIWEAIAIRPTEAQDELFRLAEAVRFLTGPHEPLGLAELGARCFGDSKALKQSPALKRRLEEWVLLAQSGEVVEEDRARVWSACGVLENATATRATVFGPLVYWKDGTRFDWVSVLHAHGETATLSWDNLRGIDRIDLPMGTFVTTCENETPFATLARQREPGLLVYTAGYPNIAVSRLLELFPAHIARIRHWGDTDLDGLCIAALLHRVRPVTLWRCGLADVERHGGRLRPLAPDRRQRAETVLARHSDFPFAAELAFTLARGWLEQESWEATP